MQKITDSKEEYYKSSHYISITTDKHSHSHTQKCTLYLRNERRLMVLIARNTLSRNRVLLAGRTSLIVPVH